MTRPRGSTIHLLLAGFWCLMAVPTLTVWANAVWWIGLISIAALVSTEVGAYSAARAQELAEQQAKEPASSS